MIEVGEKLPEGFFRVKDEDGSPRKVTTAELFDGQRVVLVGVPGAFTATCHRTHIPGFVEQADAILAKGVDRIVVMAVNDHHVMKLWDEALAGDGKIDFVSDGAVAYTRAIGMDVDLSEGGLGIRSRRFSMIVEDGVVKTLNVEPQRGITVTGAETVLEQL